MISSQLGTEARRLERLLRAARSVAAGSSGRAGSVAAGTGTSKSASDCSCSSSRASPSTVSSSPGVSHGSEVGAPVGSGASGSTVATRAARASRRGRGWASRRPLGGLGADPVLVRGSPQRGGGAHRSEVSVRSIVTSSGWVGGLGRFGAVAGRTPITTSRASSPRGSCSPRGSRGRGRTAGHRVGEPPRTGVDAQALTDQGAGLVVLGHDEATGGVVGEAGQRARPRARGTTQ